MNEKSFAFLRSFDEQHLREKKYLESEVSIIKQQVFSEAFQKGIDESKLEIAKRREALQKEMLIRFDMNISDLIEDHKKILQNLQNLILDLTVSLFKKVLGLYVEKNGLEEVKHFILNNLDALSKLPNLIITTHPENLSDAKEAITQNPKLMAYPLEIQFQEDDSLTYADCHICWEEGSIEKNMKDLISDFLAISHDPTHQ